MHILGLRALGLGLQMGFSLLKGTEADSMNNFPSYQCFGVHQHHECLGTETGIVSIAALVGMMTLSLCVRKLI